MRRGLETRPKAEYFPDCEVEGKDGGDPMSPDLKTCERVALRLTTRERAQLAEHLLASLDEADEAENERLWAEEAERRYRAYKKGLISSRPLSEVMRHARDKVA